MKRPRGPVRRRRDWPARLEAAIRARAVAAFRWGSHDCAFAAVHCIAAMCGRDVAPHLRGYRTLRGARWRLAKYGGLAGLAGDVAGRCGWNEVPPAFAQRGDAMLVRGDQVDLETGTDEALGVVDLSGLFVLVADETGWRGFPLRAGIRAWRVG